MAKFTVDTSRFDRRVEDLRRSLTFAANDTSRHHAKRLQQAMIRVTPSVSGRLRREIRVVKIGKDQWMVRVSRSRFQRFFYPYQFFPRWIAIVRRLRKQATRRFRSQIKRAA